MALLETDRTDIKVVHKEDDRQRLKQLDVALQAMAAQATRKLRLAAEKFGKALAWFERGSTAGGLTTRNAQLNSALKEKNKSKKQKKRFARHPRKRLPTGRARGGGGGGGVAGRARAARAPKARSCAASCGTSSATS